MKIKSIFEEVEILKVENEIDFLPEKIRILKVKLIQLEEEVKSYELIMTNQEEKVGLLEDTISQKKIDMEDIQH